MKVIIFGATGQDGVYLNELLSAKNIKIYRVTSKKNTSFDFIDVSNFSKVKAYIKKVEPDFVFCFSAISKTSHDVIFQNHQIISKGTLNILESIRLYRNNCKVFIPGSAVQFKLDNSSINEKTELSPNSPYAVDRINTLYLSRYYRDNFNLKIYYGFLFHHDSHLREKSHLSMEIISAIKNYKLTGNLELYINNLSYKKEFNHAKDIVIAIWKFVNQSNYFEIVIGSGIAYSIEEFIDKVFEIFNVSKPLKYKLGIHGDEIVVKSDPKLLKSLGWKQEYDLELLIKDIIEYGNFN